MLLASEVASGDSGAYPQPIDPGYPAVARRMLIVRVIRILVLRKTAFGDSRSMFSAAMRRMWSCRYGLRIPELGPYAPFT